MTIVAHGSAVQTPGAAEGGAPRPRTVYHGGAFMTAEDVRLPASTQALHYGTGVFEGIRGYWDPTARTLLVFRLNEHLERLQRSAAVLRLDLGHPIAELAELVLELLRRNDCRHDTYVRPMGYKLALEPGTSFGVRLSGVSSALTMSALPMGSYVDQRGVRCKVSRFRRVPTNCVPSSAKISGLYVNNALAMEDAVADGCDDAILLDLAGNVSEATTSNVFVVGRDGTVITPPATADLLPGITRASVIELLAAEAGITVVQRLVTAAELKDAAEVFLTGTGVEIAPVLSVDDVGYGGAAGPVTRKVKDLYSRVVHGELEAYRHWLTLLTLG